MAHLTAPDEQQWLALAHQKKRVSYEVERRIMGQGLGRFVTRQ
jgi:hypothetical protein